MRELKFRAWRTWDSRMIYDEVSSYISFKDTGEVETCSAVPLQFTGLRDKNGKEIFEGDILKTLDNMMVVEWKQERAWWVLKTILHLPESPPSQHLWYASDPEYLHAEVIGNIYENPELLLKTS